MSVNPHQFPRPGEVFLDHAAIFVEEFVASGAALERLGFTLTPLRLHASALKPGDPVVPLGTGNRCAMLRSGMLEVLGATSETPMAKQLLGQLARYPGLHLIAFSGAEAEDHHAALQASGMAPLPLARLRRTQSSADGDHDIAASIIRLDAAQWPEGRVQIVCPEMSPDAMWHPSLVRHDNGADRLSEMLVVVEDPAARAAHFGRFTQRPVRQAGRRHVLETERGRVHFVLPADVPHYLPGVVIPALPWVAALAIGVQDMAALQDLFSQRDVRFVIHGDTVQPAASEALGACLVFHERADDRVFDALADTMPDED
jgi:hypothetical protein